MLARTQEINDELWRMAEGLARAAPESGLLGLYVESLNETIDLNTSRATAALDIDRPVQSTPGVGQQPLIDLQQQIGSPSS